MHVEHEYIQTNGVRLHTVLAGPPNGQPIILLHGFPDAWFGWEVQIEALAQSGFRVIVPDQRGYNTSEKPKGVIQYRLDILVADVIGLADALGYERFCLAGHDFGAMVSWRLAMLHPQRLPRLVIANVPHPAVMAKYLQTHMSQMRKSWYAFFFQIPFLPEMVIRANHWHLLSSAMAKGLSDDLLARYHQAWAQPHAMTCMLNWYRALVGRMMFSNPSWDALTVPTLIIWGKLDPHLSYEMAPMSIDMCEKGRLVVFEDATHWVHQDKPAEFNQLMLEHFTGENSSG